MNNEMKNRNSSFTDILLLWLLCLCVCVCEDHVWRYRNYWSVWHRHKMSRNKLFPDCPPPLGPQLILFDCCLITFYLLLNFFDEE